MAAITPEETREVLEERFRQRRRRFEALTKGKSVRFRARAERMERSTNIAADHPTVRVLPKNEEFRKFLVHPLNNVGFRDKGAIEWPLDQFTLRRLRDGDITLEDPKARPQRPEQRPGRPPPPPRAPAGE
jgi:hypothetical protein